MRDDERILHHFNAEDLTRVCLAHEDSFGEAYDMTRVKIDQPGPEDFYFYKDNGSKILAVAHLDTVVSHDKRAVKYHTDKDGELIIQSGCLDDRLGAYIILELLPALGIEFDWLLTVGEESGCSTAAGFKPEKDYDWMIEFDRGGCDVVTYQYEDDETVRRVESCGATHEDGIFSDISYLEHLGIKGFNWGVGYQNYHSVNGYAYLSDTFYMLGLFLDFHRLYGEVNMPHVKKVRTYSRTTWSANSWIGGGYVDEGILGVDGYDPWLNDGPDDGSIYSDDELEYGYYDEDGYFYSYTDEELDAMTSPNRSDTFLDPDDVIEYPTPEQLRAASLWP